MTPAQIYVIRVNKTPTVGRPIAASHSYITWPISIFVDEKKKVAHEAQSSVSLMFLPHFDVLCDLLLNRRTATWNLFVLYNKELKKSFNDDVIYTSVLQ